MASAKRVITIPTELDPVAVLGSGDKVLAEVQHAFPEVNVFVRGNRIEISAYNKRDDIEADKVSDVLNNIIDAAYKAPADAMNVRRMLEARQVGKKAGLMGDGGHGHGYAQHSYTRGFAGAGVGRRSQVRSFQDDGDHADERKRSTANRHVPGVIAFANGEPVRAKTAGQVYYVRAIDANTITFAIGPAGTGKTYLAVAKAVRAFEDGRVSRIILTRPAVEAGESLGYLPGTLNDKVDPYLRPLYDALSDMLGAGQMHRYMTDGTIEVAPLAYMRGRTLNDAFVILDEAQNTTEQQMKMFLTRLGFNTKMVITGDVTQIDLAVPHSGLKSIESILGNIDGINFAHLGAKDVVRHELVGKIVQAYDAHTAEASGRRRNENSSRQRRRSSRNADDVGASTDDAGPKGDAVSAGIASITAEKTNAADVDYMVTDVSKQSESDHTPNGKERR